MSTAASAPVVAVPELSVEQTALGDAPMDYRFRLVVCKVPENDWHPEGIRSIPGKMPFYFSRDVAEAVAVDLNRSFLRKKERWAVVAYGKKGFVVAVVGITDDWCPHTPYDTPPSSVETWKTEGRAEMERFNRAQMNQSEPVRWWCMQLLVLTRPNKMPLPFNLLTSAYDVGVGAIGDDDAGDITLRVWNCEDENDALHKAGVFLRSVHKRGVIRADADDAEEGGAA